MTQTLFSNKLNRNFFDKGAGVRPSSRLRGLVRRYFEVLDNQERTSNLPPARGVQEALLNAMQEEHIPFNSGEQARWIARWLDAGEPVDHGKQTTIMFARTPSHYRVGEYDPIRDGVRELTATPFVNDEDERANAARLVPVLVTVEPLRDYGGATYARHG